MNSNHLIMKEKILTISVLMSIRKNAKTEMIRNHFTKQIKVWKIR